MERINRGSKVVIEWGNWGVLRLRGGRHAFCGDTGSVLLSDNEY